MTNPNYVDPFARAAVVAEEQAQQNKEAERLREQTQQAAARQIEEQLAARSKAADAAKLTLDPVLKEAQENEALAQKIAETQEDIAQQNAAQIALAENLAAQNEARQPNGIQTAADFVKPIVAEHEEQYNLLKQPPKLDVSLTPSTEDAIGAQDNQQQLEQSLELGRIKSRDLDITTVGLSNDALAAIEHDQREVEIALQEILGTNTIFTDAQKALTQQTMKDFEAAVARTIENDLKQTQRTTEIAPIVPQEGVETAPQKTARETQEREEDERRKNLAKELAAQQSARLLKRQLEEHQKAFKALVEQRRLEVERQQEEIQKSVDDAVQRMNERVAQQRDPNGVEALATLKAEREAQGVDPVTGGPDFNDPNNDRFENPNRKNEFENQSQTSEPPVLNNAHTQAFVLNETGGADYGGNQLQTDVFQKAADAEVEKSGSDHTQPTTSYTDHGFGDVSSNSGPAEPRGLERQSLHRPDPGDPHQGNSNQE